MAGARTRRHDGSLGDSWGTADYSDDNVSVGSVDSFSDTGSQRDYFEEHGRDILDEDDEDNMATPMPHPRTTPFPRNPQDTPTKHSATRAPGNAQMPRSGSRSFQQPTSQQSPEPAFIMPSLSASADGFNNASPLQNPRFRPRGYRQTSTSNQTRRASMRTGSAPTGDRRPVRRSRSSQYEKKENVNPTHFLSLFWENLARPILGYIFDIFRIGMNGLKPIFGLAAPIIVLILALNIGSTYFKTSFQNAVAPLCALPFSGYVVPFCKTIQPDQYADFEQLVAIQDSFEDILAKNRDSYALPVNMKKSQVAIRDLRIQVRFSNLPSKAELENEFDSFLETAREASDQLAKYNARIGYVTDQLISTNKWTLNILNGLAASESPKRTSLPSFAHLNPMSIFLGPPETLQHRIFSQYINHVTKAKDDISSLITFSESLILLLNNLDNRLDAILEIAYRDDNRLMRDREELLSQLWSRLGGNRLPKATNAASLQLLRDVLRYRATAVQLVSATHLKLREIAQGLENLRDGVAAPELAGYREDYPLQWHIEVVGRSVERLRTARGEAMAIERDVIQQGINGGLGDRGAKGIDGSRGEIPTVYPAV